MCSSFSSSMDCPGLISGIPMALLVMPGLGADSCEPCFREQCILPTAMVQADLPGGRRERQRDRRHLMLHMGHSAMTVIHPATRAKDASDEEFVRLAAQGDVGAFEAIMRRNNRSLF